MSDLDYVLACGHRRWLWEPTKMHGSLVQCKSDPSHGWQRVIGTAPTDYGAAKDYTDKTVDTGTNGA